MKWLAFLFLVALPALIVAEPRASDVLFEKYHWTIARSSADGAASTFVLCQKPELKFRVRVASRRGGRVAYLDLYVNGKFISRVDRRGAIGLGEGQGIDSRTFTPWVEVSGPAKVRTGMNRVTLVYRGRIGDGDPEAPGPGVWRGDVNFAHVRVIDMLRILKGFAQGTGLEAEIYRGFQVFDGALRASESDEALDGLDRSTHDALARSRELLGEPSTRRFYAEVDDLYHERKGVRLDIGDFWHKRLSVLDRLVSFWARSRTLRSAGRLYRRVDGLHDRLADTALARENLRNLYWIYSSRDFKSFGPDRFEATLNLGRQNLEALGDLLAQVQASRDALRAAVLAEAGATGRPAGSDDIRGPYEVLEKSGVTQPRQYTDVKKLEHLERELNLYFTLLEEFIGSDRDFLALELAFLAELIGKPRPEPAKNRRVLRARQKWEK